MTVVPPRNSDAGSRTPDDEIRRRTPPVAGGRELRIGVFVLAGLVSFLMVIFLAMSAWSVAST